jgi:hypothetical protein
MLSLLGDPLTGRRVWFTESHLVLVTVFSIMFYLFIFYSWYNKWSTISSKTTRSFLGSWQSLLCTPTYTTLARDWIRTGLLASLYCSQPFRRLNLSPPTYHQRFWIYVDRLNPKRTAMDRPWLTPANLTNKYIKNVRLQYVRYHPHTSYSHCNNVACQSIV